MAFAGKIEQGRLRLLMEDAERGEARAQRLLALRYLRGRGVGRDPALAYQWMERAAAQGLALAQRSLGELLEQGVCGPRDMAGAERLYRLSAQQGDPIARHHLARLGKP